MRRPRLSEGHRAADECRPTRNDGGMPLGAVVNRAQQGVKSKGRAECDRFRLTRGQGSESGKTGFSFINQVLALFA